MNEKQIIRLEEIKAELVAIDEGYTDMLNGNETHLDRVMRLSYELIDMLEGN